MQQRTLKEKIITLVEAHDMLPAIGRVPVVLMVSGGSDSVALARLLPVLYPQHLYTILHINHQLRAEDAEKDELFVVHLAQELDLPCEVRRVDIGVLAAKTGDNLEQAGRSTRYREANVLLDGLCEQAGADPTLGRIVTAHTLDDRVETFFMRSIVGGGVGALGSIPYVNGRVIRPLLDCTRLDLQGWLHAQRWLHASRAGVGNDEPAVAGSRILRSAQDDTGSGSG
jgi:tRNA(Ile)-lysidine synthase